MGSTAMAETGGVAVAGNVSESAITVVNGMPHEQVITLVQGITSPNPVVQHQALDLLRAQLPESSSAIHVEAVGNLLQLILARDVPVEQWGAALTEADEHVRKLLAQDYRVPNEASDEERHLIAEARRALERFDFARAESVQQERHAILERRFRDAQELMAAQMAESRAEIAATVAASLDYRRAAELYREAAETRHLADHLQWHWHSERAGTLYDLGREFGDIEALAEAIALYRDTVLPLSQSRSDRAASLLWLGDALKRLGLRELGTSTLRAAERAYRECAAIHAGLEDEREEAIALCSAGNALLLVGEREHDVARLRKAVATHRSALKKLCRESAPFDWAFVQNSLGVALLHLARTERNIARLEEGLKAFQSAGQVRTRNAFLFEWAETLNNIGGALRSLGELVGDTAALVNAALAYHAVLEVWTRKRLPTYWAETQANLSGVELLLFEKTGIVAHLNRAEAHARSSLEVFEAGAPQDVAMVQMLLLEIAERRRRLGGGS